VDAPYTLATFYFLYRLRYEEVEFVWSSAMTLIIKFILLFFILMGLGWAYDAGLGQSVRWNVNFLIAGFGVASVAALRARCE
jgi:hypothetical protein